MDRSFPRHPTSNQLFSGEQFDAYRALGWAVAREVIETVNPSWDLFDVKISDGDISSGPALVV